MFPHVGIARTWSHLWAPLVPGPTPLRSGWAGRPRAAQQDTHQVDMGHQANTAQHGARYQANAAHHGQSGPARFRPPGQRGPAWYEPPGQRSPQVNPAQKIGRTGIRTPEPLVTKNNSLPLCQFIIFDSDKGFCTWYTSSNHLAHVIRPLCA
jgi:hypothetical protein